MPFCEQTVTFFIRSVNLGVGPPLSPERTRMLMALRINVLAKGYSGISLNTLHRVIAAFNGRPNDATLWYCLSSKYISIFPDVLLYFNNPNNS